MYGLRGGFGDHGWPGLFVVVALAVATAALARMRRTVRALIAGSAAFAAGV